MPSVYQAHCECWVPFTKSFCVLCAEPSFNFLNYLLIYWLCWVFTAACGLSLLTVRGSHSSLWGAGFSPQWLLLSRSTGSGLTGFSSCGTQAQLLSAMWNHPSLGIEPVSLYWQADNYLLYAKKVPESSFKTHFPSWLC